MRPSLLNDTTLAVTVLNTLDGNTSGTVNANTVTTLSGAAADLNTAYDSSGISKLGDEAVTVDSGTASTAQANSLAAATTGVVTATLSDGDLATLAGLTETGNAYSITITDTSVDAAALNTLDSNTAESIDASNITTLTGSASDLITAYASGGITGLGNEAVTLSNTTLAVTVLNTLDGNTSGTVNANTVTTLTGAAADLNTAYDSSGIGNLGDEAVLSTTPPSRSLFSTPSTATHPAPLTPTPSPHLPVQPQTSTPAELRHKPRKNGPLILFVTHTNTSLSASVLNTLDVARVHPAPSCCHQSMNSHVTTQIKSMTATHQAASSISTHGCHSNTKYCAQNGHQFTGSR